MLLTVTPSFATLDINSEVNDENTTQSYMVCPSCDRGALIDEVYTAKDYDYYIGPHGSCNLNYSHYQYWYYEVRDLSCDSCSFYQRVSRGPDYGWFCE